MEEQKIPTETCEATWWLAPHETVTPPGQRDDLFLPEPRILGPFSRNWNHNEYMMGKTWPSRPGATKMRQLLL